MEDPRARLKSIADQLAAGKKPEKITVRDFLGWFNSQRRGTWIVATIQEALLDNGISTDPDFTGQFIDGEISFVARDAKAALTAPPEPSIDPTYRIGRLPAANKPPVSVKPNDPLEKATTLMAKHDFSQVPVMTSDREVKGMVSWKTVGMKICFNEGCTEVRDTMAPHQEISSNASIFDAIRTIVNHDYVLIRAPDNRISGIVTTSDLSLQFQQLAEPFLLIGEIENYVRRLLRGKFSKDELSSAKDPEDKDRTIERVSDLTFGEYVRLIEDAKNWQKLKLKIDRKEFIASLDEIRRIRNDVMHFDPDGISEHDLYALRETSRFLQRMASIDVL